MKQKFSEAIHQMNPGDRFKTSESIDIVCVVGDDPPDAFLFEWDDSDADGYIRMTSCIMEYKGEIIRAEPEVLRIEQIYKNHFIDDYDITPAIGESTRRLLSSVDKNGQIKEWKRLKPLIDAALNEEMNATHELRNLTPPYEPEK